MKSRILCAVIGGALALSCARDESVRTEGDGVRIAALVRAADSLIAKRQWGDALSLAKEVIAADTGNFEGRYYAAIARRELGAFAYRGESDGAHSRFGDWGDSRRNFMWILDRDSSFKDALYQYALLLRYEGDRTGALNADLAQIRRKPDLIGPQVGLYRLYRAFMAEEDSARFVAWLSALPGSIPRLYRAETQRRHGDLSGAKSALASLLARPGDASPQAIRLSLARVLFSEGDLSGAEREYRAAIDELDSRLGGGILFEDLKYIVTDDEIASYAGCDSIGRVRDFFRAFWNFRNPSPALRSNLRMLEHIRRMIYAEQHFEYFGARTWFNNPDRDHELRFPLAFALNDEFNDQGLIYLRQGPPDDVIRQAFSPNDGVRSFGSPLNARRVGTPPGMTGPPPASADDLFESWLYEAMPESPRMIFHFEMHNAVGNNWRFVPLPSLDAMLGDLAIWDARYQRLFDEPASGRLLLQAQLKNDMRETVEYALSTEKLTWENRKETFQFPHHVDVFRAPGGQSLVDISYAIPRAALPSSIPWTVASIPMEVGFSLFDASARHVVVRCDTLQVSVAARPAAVPLHLIRCTVPPDSYAVAMHIRPLQGGKIGTWHEPLRVADFSLPRLQVSSIQLLEPSSEQGALEIDGVKVAQSPFRAHVRTEPLLVYFHVYHLVADALGATSYVTRCILVPPDHADSERGIVLFSREKTGTSEMADEFYSINVNTVAPGAYRLVVSVTDRKRVETVVAGRDIELIKR